MKQIIQNNSEVVLLPMTATEGITYILSILNEQQ